MSRHRAKGSNTHPLIPAGLSCSGEHGLCPYWGVDARQPAQLAGTCSYTRLRDAVDGTILFDQVKACRTNVDARPSHVLVALTGREVRREAVRERLWDAAFWAAHKDDTF